MKPTTTVTIPYAPRYPAVHETLESHRFVVLVAHRRFGKTVLAVNHLLKSALTCRRERGSFAYVAPFRNQAKEIAWGYLKHYSAPLPGREVNESSLCVTLPNGARVRIFGADNPDALRGLYFDGVVLDEVAQMKPELWQEIVRPALADRMGRAVFIGTPKGVNLFSELYEHAKRMQAEAESLSAGGASGSCPKGAPEGHSRSRACEAYGYRQQRCELGATGEGSAGLGPANMDTSPERKSDWAALCFRADESDALDAAELARLRAELSDNAWRQEMLCDFTAASDDALIPIDLASEAARRVMTPADVAGLPVVVGVDVARFGADATVFMRRQGLAAFAPVVLRGLDNMAVADRLAAYMDEFRPDAVFIDAGGGAGVIDRLRRMGRNVAEAPFGARALNDARFVNRRAEMWRAVRDWLLAGGALPDDAALKSDLSTPRYEFDAAGRLKLESKDEIKARLGRSPDRADALALTFYAPAPMRGAARVGVRTSRPAFNVWR